MDGLGTKNRRKLMKSADDTEGGIFSIVIKYCIRSGKRLSYKKDCFISQE